MLSQVLTEFYKNDNIDLEHNDLINTKSILFEGDVKDLKTLTL